jgi:hypothetical protein
MRKVVTVGKEVTSKEPKKDLDPLNFATIAIVL